MSFSYAMDKTTVSIIKIFFVYAATVMMSFPQCHKLTLKPA